MKVTVRLYGTLSQRFPDYQPSQGLEVDMPEGAKVEDLLSLLQLPESQGAVVIAEGRVLKADAELRRRVPVNVMQSVGGG